MVSCPQLTGLHMACCWRLNMASALLAAIGNQPFIASLKRLCIDVRQAGITTELLTLAAETSSLEELLLPSELVTIPTLQRLANAWQIDGCAQLKALTTSLSTDLNLISTDTLALMGTTFPHLRKVGIGGIIQGPPPSVGYAFHHVQELNIGELFLPSLEHVYSSPALQTLLQSLVIACPVITSFIFKAGMRSADYNDEAEPEAHLLPSPGDALCKLPQSLSCLSLTSIRLTQASLMPANLPNLKSIQFIACGSAALALSESLVALCPQLKLQRCCVGPTLESAIDNGRERLGLPRLGFCCRL